MTCCLIDPHATCPVAVHLRQAAISRVWRADKLLETVPRWPWRTTRWRRETRGWLYKQCVAVRCWKVTSSGRRHEGGLIGERATRGQPEERKCFWSNLPSETSLEELAGLAIGGRQSSRSMKRPRAS